MKKCLGMVFCAGLAGAVCAQEVKPAAAAQEAKPAAAQPEVKPAAAAPEVKPAEGKLQANAGADLRVRQELIDNLPMAKGAVMPNNNYLRVRPRVWGEVKTEDFKAYMRLTDEFREYFQPSESRNYQAPDEVLVDNLYLDFYNLFDDRVDLRIGRQDFFGPGGPSYGAGRVLADGTPFDGSRTVFMDAIKATVKFDEKNALDLLAIYNSPETELSWGHPEKADGSEYKERPLTSINPRSKDMAEWGGGLYFKSKEVDDLPFELYYLYKREEKARMPDGSKLQGRIVNTWGARVMPKLTETLSAEFEGAVQAGQKDGGAATAGYLGYGGLTYKPLVDSTAKPFFTGSCYYLSGDKDRGADDNDTAWDPLWSRWPQFSELYVYNFTYGAGYWSNLLYPSLETGVGFSPGHKVRASIGPMYAAVEDDMGVPAGSTGGDLYGWLGVVRYDFPILKAKPGKRGDLSGHVTAEVLDPGDYYESDTVAYFLRWEIIAKF